MPFGAFIMFMERGSLNSYNPGCSTGPVSRGLILELIRILREWQDLMTASDRKQGGKKMTGNNHVGREERTFWHLCACDGNPHVYGGCPEYLPLLDTSRKPGLRMTAEDMVMQM